MVILLVTHVPCDILIDGRGICPTCKKNTSSRVKKIAFRKGNAHVQ